MSVLRRGGGLNKSSSENVLAVAPPEGWGLLRLNIDGFLIPSRPNNVFGAPGVVAPPAPLPVPPPELVFAAYAT